MCVRSRWFVLFATTLLAAACGSTRQPSVTLPPEFDRDDPTSATQLMQQGQALVLDSRFDEGIARYKAALELQPKNPTIHNLWGVAELQRGEPAKAIEHFNQALGLAPAYSDARSNRGAAYARLGQFAMAEGDYLAVLGDSTHANRAGVYFNLGALYLERGSLSAAEENLKRAVAQSGPVDAYLLLGRVEERLVKLESAENAYRAALDKSPDRADIAWVLAVLLEKQGRKEAAAEVYGRILVFAPSSPEAQLARAKLGK